jgi:hypothetical protein
LKPAGQSAADPASTSCKTQQIAIKTNKMSATFISNHQKSTKYSPKNTGFEFSLGKRII